MLQECRQLIRFCEVASAHRRLPAAFPGSTSAADPDTKASQLLEANTIIWKEFERDESRTLQKRQAAISSTAVEEDSEEEDNQE
ncbi:unnamed protein product [Clonostachys byssicola]|uniref:Uncharacterized protein n=1 Tax=Clonostachys byssicola TaxID=160290 RepID=A0A9N9Y430_9HYPO|nr:unnamed protein product [Clonostachys byssicola]